MNKTPFLCLLLFCGCTMYMPNQQFNAGFRVVRMVDSSRIYKPNTNTTDYLHYRPIDIDIWYPARISTTDTALNFKYFLDLFGSRANYYTASKAGDSLAAQFSKAFCEGFKCSTPAKLFSFKTSSYKNAKQVAAKFPLVVYLASYNGMGYENYKLFEDLAKKGYVVVSISSIGRYPGDMTMKNEDMMEQVNDAVAALKHLQNDPQIDFSKTALLGYSWGGVADAVLATKLQNVKCIISFEGSEFHHYGSDKGEDADFDGIKNSPAFQKMSLNIPYLRLEGSPSNKNSKKDSVYNFTQKLTGNNIILKVDSAEHEDFCYLPVAVKASGNCKTGELYNTITQLTISFLDEHLKGTTVSPSVFDKLMADKRLHR
ncbi:MAG: dienelactone hydrolase family protein [Mucilaginibacter sp.]